MPTKDELMGEIADYFQEASPSFGVLCSGDDIEWLAEQVLDDDSEMDFADKIAHASQRLYDLKMETM